MARTGPALSSDSREHPFFALGTKYAEFAVWAAIGGEPLNSSTAPPYPLPPFLFTHNWHVVCLDGRGARLETWGSPMRWWNLLLRVGQRAKGKCGRPTARRSVRTTGATSERSASSNAVVLLGFEPRSPALQTVVLPLNYRTNHLLRVTALDRSHNRGWHNLAQQIDLVAHMVVLLGVVWETATQRGKGSCYQHATSMRPLCLQTATRATSSWCTTHV